jgi:DNA-binding FrmR family transcriptional regulator
MDVGRRLKIARGHLDKVIALVETGAYCPEIIHQSQAVQAALAQIDKIVLEGHLKTCVADQIKKGKTEEVINEVMKILEKKQ